MELLVPIPVDMDPDALAKELHVDRIGAWDPFQSAFEAAAETIAPRAGYTVQFVEERTGDGVVIDGVRFSSRVLSKNLEDVGRVFPYVTTIGDALELRLDSGRDLLENYYLDAISNMVLIRARTHLEEVLRRRFALGGLSFMSPGSLKDWPIQEQKPLFSFFDDAAHILGVTLAENCLMSPKKSVSGIYFPTSTHFFSCQLCPRVRCVGRKAPYSRELAEEYGIAQEKEAP
jgi:hypothetical protein